MLHLRHCTVKSRPEGLIDIADGMVTVNGGECSIAEFNEATGRFDGVDNLTQTKYEEKGDTIVITGNSLAIHDFAADSGQEVDGEARLSLVVTNRQGCKDCG